MGVCVETLKVACKKELEELSNTIEGEMKDAAMAGVNGKYVTGLAASAVHIEMGEMSAFVGGTDGTGKGITGTDHLAMINDGNGGKRIYAKGKALGKYPGGIPGIGWRKSVAPYGGNGFIHKIAARHR